jgi:hypothetical protein
MFGVEYSITVTGDISDAILSALPEFRSEIGDHEVVLTGRLRDRSEFYGLVDRLNALGLELTDVHRIQ